MSAPSIGRIPQPNAQTGRDSGSARKPDRRILTAEGPAIAAVYDRARLSAGAEIAGPAIIEQIDTTTLIEAGWHGTVAPSGTLLLTAG